MEDLVAHIRRRLHLEDARVHDGPLAGARADLVLRRADHTWIIEIKGGQVRQEALARLALLRDLWLAHNPGPVTPVLVAASVPRQLREMASVADIGLLEVPMELVPPAGSPDVPLTSERSWRVVSRILQDEGAGSIESLASACQVSMGWVHRVVRSLADRGFIGRSRGRIRLVEEERLLDAVGLERPLRSVELARIDSGYDDWDALVQLLQAQLTQMASPVVWGLGGTSAAALWTGYEVRHNRLDAYVPPSVLGPLLRGAKGGIPIHVLRPDRELAIATVHGLQAIGLHQTLLDALGLGYGQRDVALAVLKRLRS